LETADAGWAPRGQIGGSAVFNDRMWVIGGGTYDDGKSFNDVWSSGDGVDWRQELASAPWSAREYHEIIVFDD
jgi:hypothetical protein